VNRLVLAAQLVERRALRYTPAGLPALDFELKHQSELSEDGQPRKVSLQLRAVAIGRIVPALAALELGSAGSFGGFLAPARNGRGLLFHVTDFEPATI
jgi:primosomal replication protein N